MTRKKVNLEYIISESKRKATYKKRKSCLIKKTNEISTLCGIQACAIVYSDDEPHPEVWPSHFDVQRVLHKFEALPELEKDQKMLDQETFLKKRIIKAREHLMKQRNQNMKKKMDLLMFKCLSSGTIVDNNIDVSCFLWVIDETLKEVELKKTRDQSQSGIHVAENGSKSLSGEKEPCGCYAEARLVNGFSSCCWK
ncbi:PREDICTED: agamous-like MADS-box protein AGL80 [Lupinus angustifolius]|uniref:agamous-like MADS-box protein AGL80 n=1 Tax=Lupinus angustifolius TaxID=3871 RepID=UPI00092FD0F8|nr:PREDICTED: agamous-like MADS-box protein AGL80 [Lupinus angustifolius]